MDRATGARHPRPAVRIRVRPKGALTTPDRFNLAEHFVDRHVAEGRGARTALITEGRERSYAEIQTLANRAGNRLRRQGIAAGQRVLLMLPDGADFAAAYFGAAKIGAVAVPTSTFLRPPDYAYCFEESQARLVVVDPSLESALPAGAPRLAAAPGWLDEESAELDAPATTADDIAFWLWTSGSTGAPKAALHRHRDWLCCCEGYARGVLGIGPDDRVLSSSKMFHAYGLGNSLLFPFFAGAASVLYAGRPQARAILDLAERFRPTLFFSVPTLYAAMLAETERENPYRLASVRLAVSAAEPLPAELCRRWRERFGFEILDGLGSTEALHIYVSARAGEVRPGSSGRPVPGYEVRVTDERGDPAPPGEVGDLWVRGASVAAGYWNRPELNAQRFRDGWFFTCDKYIADAEGCLWYAGRSDDMFRVSGQWVSPAEVEAALAEHPAVLESAVVPHPDENRLTKPKAFVVLKPGAEAGEAVASELQDFVKGRIAPYKYPRRIEFLAELPKTATGKIQRFKLRG